MFLKDCTNASQWRRHICNYGMRAQTISHGVWHYPSQWSSKNIVMINWIRTTYSRKHVRLRMVVTATCCEWVSFHDVIWSYEAFPKSEVVLNDHTWTWNNPHAIHERMFHTVRYIMGSYFPRDRLSAQRYRNLVKIVLQDCLKACPWPWSKGCGFRRMELRHIMWKVCGSVCVAKYPGRWMDVEIRLLGLLGLQI